MQSFHVNLHILKTNMIHIFCIALCCSVMSNSFHPIDYSTQVSSVHGIIQARILEWVAMPSSRGSSQPRDRNQAPGLQVDSLLSDHQGSPRILEWVAYPFSRDRPNPGVEPGSPALQADSLTA